MLLAVFDWGFIRPDKKGVTVHRSVDIFKSSTQIYQVGTTDFSSFSCQRSCLSMYVSVLF